MKLRLLGSAFALCSVLATSLHAESEFTPSHANAGIKSVLNAASAPAPEDRVDINNVPNDVSPASFIQMLDGFLEKQETDLIVTTIKQSQLEKLAIYIGATSPKDYSLNKNELVLNASFLCKFLGALKTETTEVLVGTERADQARAVASQVTQHKLAKAFFFNSAGECGKGIVKSLKLLRCGNERILDLDLNTRAEAFVGRSAQLETDEIKSKYVQDLDREHLDPFKKMNLNLELGGKSDEGKMRFVLRQSRNGLGKDLAARSDELLRSYKSVYLWEELKSRVEAKRAGRFGKMLRWPQAACVLRPEICVPYAGTRSMEERIAFQEVSIAQLKAAEAAVNNPARDQDIERQLDEMNRKQQAGKVGSSDAMKRERLTGELNHRAHMRNEIPKLFAKLEEESAFYESATNGRFAANTDSTQLIIPENISSGCASASPEDPPNGKLGLAFRTIENSVKVTSTLKEIMHHPGPPATVFSRMRTQVDF